MKWIIEGNTLWGLNDVGGGALVVLDGNFRQAKQEMLRAFKKGKYLWRYK